MNPSSILEYLAQKLSRLVFLAVVRPILVIWSSLEIWCMQIVYILAPLMCWRWISTVSSAVILNPPWTLLRHPIHSFYARPPLDPTVLAISQLTAAACVSLILNVYFLGRIRLLFRSVEDKSIRNETPKMARFALFLGDRFVKPWHMQNDFKPRKTTSGPRRPLFRLRFRTSGKSNFQRKKRL